VPTGIPLLQREQRSLAFRRGTEGARSGCEGGALTDAFLPYGRQDVDEADIQAVVDALRSELITQGPLVPQFEEALARYLGARHVVAFANGTAALHGAAFAAGLGPGHEVLTTPLSFVASANCALYQGARPRFVDIDPATLNLDTAAVSKRVERRTRAVVAVSFAGLPVDLAPLESVRERIVVIEDASHALGSRRSSTLVGGPDGADLTTFSLHPVKAMTTGEGGFVSTERDDLAEKLRLFRTHGIVKGGPAAAEEPWLQEMRLLGFNYRITDFQCALGLSQLERLDDFVAARNRIAARYREVLSEVDGIELPPGASAEDLHAYHLFVVRLLGGSAVRRRVFAAMRGAGIGVQVHYIPIYRHPYYRDELGYPQDECPKVEDYYGGAISLPIFPGMTDADVERVAGTLSEASS